MVPITTLGPRCFSLLAAATLVLGAGAARAQNVSFLAEIDRDAIAPGEAFVYEITLTVGGESVEDYRPPEFKGLRVLSAPQAPSRSTQMQMGGGQTIIQNSFSWRYELVLPSASRSPLVVGAARVRVAGREVRSNTLSLRVIAPGAGTAPPSGRPGQPLPGRGQRGGGFPFDLFGGAQPGASPPAEPNASGAGAFVRAVADKPRAFVGEQVTVTWTLYTPQRPDRYNNITEPRTDGFWSEDIPSTTPKGRLNFAQEMLGGRPYLVATLGKRALFPLHEGKLTVTPLEGEISQVDFFGATLRAQRLKTDPLPIEVVPLPREGQPAGFDAGNVGRYTLDVRADRTAVAVGEAVTITATIRGTGNVRNVKPPPLPRLDGWKMYEPKTEVSVDPGEALSGTKNVEVLMLPERPGVTSFPALRLQTFDPQTKRYAAVESQPLRLEVKGEGGPAARVAAGGAPSGGIENLIGAEIRPIRARPHLARDAGVTFLRSRGFFAVLFAPPLALALAVGADRLRGRLARESTRSRRRRMRSLVRKRLGAAEAHRDAGRGAALYIEVDRVLREVLASRLGRPVGGLRMDELGALLRARGMGAADADRIVAELEACDQARFAPGGDTGAPGGRTADRNAELTAELTAAIERAADLIVAIEKAPLREGAS